MWTIGGVAVLFNSPKSPNQKKKKRIYEQRSQQNRSERYMKRHHNPSHRYKHDTKNGESLMKNQSNFLYENYQWLIMSVSSAERYAG